LSGNDKTLDLEFQAKRAECTVAELIGNATRHRRTELNPAYARPTIQKYIDAAVFAYEDRGHVMGWVQDYVRKDLHIPQNSVIQEDGLLVPA
jgi:hypothetical protein